MDKDFLVAIFAGHGGSDPGAVDPEDKAGDDEIYEDKLYTEESLINLRATLILRNLLREKGYQVLLVRDREEYVSLSKRVEMANDSDVDIVISLHCNAATSSGANGIETFYHHKSSRGKRLASFVQKAMISVSKARNRHIKPNSTFYVLRKTLMPAVLIEMGFITNIQEEILLNKDEYLHLLMEAVSSGVSEYKKYYH